MNDLHERAVKAAIRFCEHRGYEILDEGWTKEGTAGRIDLVAREDDVLVFIDVTVAEQSDGGFKEGNLTREQFEMLAALYLGENEPEGDIPVRFDSIDLIVVNDNRALLRHHINRLGSCAEALA